MATLEITTNSAVNVVVSDPVFQADTVTFAGAGTMIAGTILARNVSTNKLVPFVNGGTAAVNGTPCAVLLDDLVAAGAGDEVARPIIAGKLRFSKLVIDGDGDNSAIDEDVKDQCRRTGLIVLTTQQLAELDNIS